MKDAKSNQELLLRYLDGNLLPEEKTKVDNLLRCDPEARAFLREVAEQAVTVADVERVKERRRSELEARQGWAGNRREALSMNRRTSYPFRQMAVGDSRRCCHRADHKSLLRASDH